MASGQLGILVFSRMSSSRLPRKAMLPFADRPLALHVWRRASYTGYPVFLATSKRGDDDELVELAEEDDIPVYRGSLDDVLSRAVAAAEHWDLVGFARLCGDRPFFCIDGMKRALDTLAAEIRSGSGDTAMFSNAVELTPTSGLATEIIRTSALKNAARHCDDAYQREHVTPLLYKDAAYSVRQIEEDPDYYRGPGLAVDTRSDYLRLSAISNIDGRVDIPTRVAMAHAVKQRHQE